MQSSMDRSVAVHQVLVHPNFKVLIQLLMARIKDIYGTKQSDKRGNIPKDPKFYIKPPGNVDTIVRHPNMSDQTSC